MKYFYQFLPGVGVQSQSKPSLDIFSRKGSEVRFVGRFTFPVNTAPVKGKRNPIINRFAKKIIKGLET